MKNAKKRVPALLLCLCVVMTLLLIEALAADTGLTALTVTADSDTVQVSSGLDTVTGTQDAPAKLTAALNKYAASFTITATFDETVSVKYSTVSAADIATGGTDLTSGTASTESIEFGGSATKDVYICVTPASGDPVTPCYYKLTVTNGAKTTPTATLTGAASLTYNKSEQKLITSVSTDPEDVTVQYALGESADAVGGSPDWKSNYTDITGTNAGTYYVWYKVDEGDTYAAVEPTYSGTAVTIAQATATVTTPPTARTSLTYTGTQQALITAGIAGEGSEMQYSVGDGAFSAAIPQGLTAGTYTVKYKAVPSDTTNYKESAEQTLETISIAKAKVTSLDTTNFTASSKNGTDLAAIISALPTTVQFTADGSLSGQANIEWENSVATGSYDPGTAAEQTFTVTGTVSLSEPDSKNYDLNGNTTVTANITTTRDASTTTVTPTSPSESYTYGGTLNLTITVAKTDGISLASVDANKVQVSVNGTPFTTLADVTSGSATLAIPITKTNGFTIGSNTITAEYGGSVTLNGGSSESLTINVDKKALTYTLTASEPTTRTYDGTKSVTVTAAATDPATGDSPTITVTAELTSADVNTYTSVNVTSATIDGDLASYYTLQQSGAHDLTNSVTIEKATPTVTTPPTASAITYGALLNTSTLTGGEVKFNSSNIDGSWAWAPEANADSTYPEVSSNNAFKVTFTPNSGNYKSVTYENVTVTVSPFTLTPTVTAGSVQNREYNGGTDTTGGTLSFSNKPAGAPFNGDTPAATGTITFTDKNVGENKTVEVSDITLTDDDSGNYTLSTTSLSSQPTNAEITAKSVTLTWSGYDDLIYNNQQKNVTATISEGKVESDNLTVTVSGGNQINAGTDYTATATLEGDDAGNYEISNATQNYTISKSVVTFTETDDTTTYDTKAHKVTLSNTVTGGAPILNEGNGDYTVHYAATGNDFDTGDENETKAGEYDVWVKLSDNAFENYEFIDKTQTSRVGKLTVNTATLDLTVPAITITYGDELADSLLSDSSAKITGDNGAAITGTWTWEATEDTYPQVSDSNSTGYTVVFTPDTQYQGNFVDTSLKKTVTITVNRKELTPSINAVEDIEQFNGETATTGTITLTGAVRGESPTATGTFNFDSATAGENKTVTVTDIALSGSWGDNYELSAATLANVTTNAKIGKRVVTLEWKLNGEDNFIVGYTGSPVSVTATVTNPVEGYEVNVDVTDGGKANAGTYTAIAALTDPDNYALPDDGSQQKEYTITPATVSFEIGSEVKAAWPETETNADPNAGGYTNTDSGLSMTYDSYTHKVNVTQTTGEGVVAIPEGGFTVTYKKDGSDLTEIRDAGTYDIYVNLQPVEDSAYNFVFDGQEETVHSLKLGTITVAPYEVTVTWTHTNYVYHGHPMHPVIKVQNAFNGDSVWDMSGGLPADFDSDSPENYTGNDLVAFAATNNSKVGAYDVTAQLYGKNAGNYTIANATGTIHIVAAPVTFTVSDNIWIVGESHKDNVTLRPAWGEVATEPDPDMTANHQYPAAGTKIDGSLLNLESDIEIEYRKDGEPVEAPTEAGTYEVWVKIANTNFHHSATGSGDFHNVGELVIANSSEEVKTYTVTFDPNGGQGGPAQMTDILSGQTIVLPGDSGVDPGTSTPYELKREGFIFQGWTYDGVTYQPNEEFHMPGADVTFKAEWLEQAKTHSVSGTVKQYTDADESESHTLTGATVTLKQGAETLAEAVTDSEGTFTFMDLVPGIYNLVIRYSGGRAEIVKTFMVTITDVDVSGEYTLPSGALNTVVEVDPGITAVVDMDAITRESEIYTEDDKQTVANGGTVEFDMKVEAAEPTPEQLEKLPVPEDSIGMTLDLTLTKTVTVSGGNPRSEEIPDSRVLITTLVHLPAELQGKTSYTVYRFHENEDGTVEMHTITTSPNSEGEYLEVVRDGTAIELHAKYYSTYVLTWLTWSPGPGVTTYRINLPEEAAGGKVTSDRASASSGSLVTLAVEIGEGCDLRSLSVTDSNGDPVALTCNGDGTYTFTMPSGAVTVSAEFVKCPSLDFPDLNVSDWYHPYTDYVIENGLMSGVEGGMFDPEGTVTRAQMVTVLWNRESSPQVNYILSFTDVTGSEWYAEAIRWAASEGIVSGYSDGSFQPDKVISREEMAVILYRYEQKYGNGGFAGDWGYELPFADKDMVEGWALEAVAWCNMNGIIQGKDSNLFDPYGTARRNEMAAILKRYLELDEEDK